MTVTHSQFYQFRTCIYFAFFLTLAILQPAKCSSKNMNHMVLRVTFIFLRISEVKITAQLLKSIYGMELATVKCVL